MFEVSNLDMDNQSSIHLSMGYMIQ